MRIGEVWKYTLSEYVHYVRIDNMDVLRDYPQEIGEEWIGFEYCDKDGGFGDYENRSGDSMLRREFLTKYKKVR